MKKDGDAFDESFKIELKLGAGGFGTVYKATRNIDNLPVAVKQIPRHKIHDWDQVSTIDNVAPVNKLSSYITHYVITDYITQLRNTFL